MEVEKVKGELGSSTGELYVYKLTHADTRCARIHVA